MSKRLATPLLLSAAILLVSCGSSDAELAGTQAAIAGTQTAIAETQNTIAGTQPPPTPTWTPTPRPPSLTPTKPSYPACSAATPGTFVTCQIDRAYCSYRPDVNGQPTFCNDAPFPGHSFTFLVFGQDWSDFDGHCLLVTGQITRFRGKPQIEATSRSQAEFCC